ncbi:hypothetical protein [Candidatus Uabimicrobium sp. HlEnr_7]|uniref:hypothetical protein n=1 Tax=Candidatus Uabimicrobium helgolandensis TaxID=3095367 RepID=UPI003557AF80
MIHNNHKIYGITLCEIMVLATITFILFSALAVVNISASSFTNHRTDIKQLIVDIERSLVMYRADLGMFPPDRPSNVDHKPVSAGECTPSNAAPIEGIFDNTVSEYHDDNLLRHLDGDTSNDTRVRDYEYVSIRPLDNYLHINE